MYKWAAPFALAAAGLVAVPETGKAFGRRRCQPAPCPTVCPCPVPVAYPVYPPAAPTVGAAPMVGAAPVPAAAAAAAGRVVRIKGKTYRLVPTSDHGAFHESEHAPAAPVADPNNSFRGKDRKGPKTTIVTGAAVEDFSSVRALLANILGKKTDDQMEASSGIKKSTMERKPPENRNVRVTGFIYAFTKEGDNDYHVIIGDAVAGDPVLLNVEVSGLPDGPPSENLTRLTAVRAVFKTTMGVGETGPQGYLKPVDEAGNLSPIPVRVTGSLFWDVDHKPGEVGPAGMRPKTSWEIHPVSAIEFLDP